MGTVNDSDQRLLERIRSGDGAAFVALIEKYKRMVERLAARLIDDPADREEACQDTFVRVHRGIPAFRGDAPLGAWIANIAHHTAVNYLKRRSTRASRMSAPVDVGSRTAEIATGEPGPDARAAATELRRLVHREMALLPAIQRTVLTLHHLQGMPIDEIAAGLRLPAGTVKSHLFRARKRLKDQMLERFSAEELRP